MLYTVEEIGGRRNFLVIKKDELSMCQPDSEESFLTDAFNYSTGTFVEADFYDNLRGEIWSK